MHKSGKSPEQADGSFDGVPRMLITIDEFCRSTSIGKTTYHALVKAGSIKRVKIGRSTRIEFAEISRFLKRLENTG
jgi:excisionase family DNA binding protein